MIDIENHRHLIGYLVDRGLITAGEEPDCTNLYGGVSNRTVLVCRPDGSRWVIKQALEKLRVSADWFSDPHRIHREAEGLRWLARLTRPGSVPGFVFEDHAHHLLAMEAVPEPHRNYKELLMERPPAKQHAADFAGLLADIHLNSHRRRRELSAVFDDSRFFESLRLDPYYVFSARQVPEAAPFLLALVDQCRNRKLTLVHGDYSPKNILIHEGRLVLLDHEVIHFGDPAFDLGFALAHFLSKANFHESRRRDFFTVAALFWKTYAARTAGAPWAAGLEYHCIANLLGCLLARAAGKSPVEYLSAAQRTRQQHIAVTLMGARPDTIAALLVTFSEQLENHE